MAAITRRISDLSGADGAEVRRFVNPADGVAMEIDMTDQEWAEFLAKSTAFLASYLEKARPGNWRPQGMASAVSDADKARNAAIRAWARNNGHEIGDRGRIPEEIVSAYATSTSATTVEVTAKPATPEANGRKVKAS